MLCTEEAVQKYLLLLLLPGDFLGGSVVKNLPASAGEASLIPRSGRASEEGNGNQLQYSCLGNPVDREEPGGLQPMGITKEMDVAQRLNNKRWF